MNTIIRSFVILLVAGLGFIALPQDGHSQAKDPKVRRALQQIELGASRQAINELKQVIAESPKNAEAHAALAIAYLQSKQVDLAATTAQAAFDLDRKVVLARTARAMVYGRQGDHKAALKEFDQAIKLDEKEISTYLELSRFYLAVDSAKRAEVMLYRAQAINDKDVRPYLGLGEFYEKQRIKDLAISQYEEAKKLDPNDVSVKAKLAGLYFRNRQYNESINEWISVARTDSTFSQAYYEIGRLYFLAEQFGNASSFLEKYTTMEPDDINGFWLLAQALTENNQFQRALPALEKVAQNDSLKALSELLLAKSYVSSKDYTKALEIYRKGGNLGAGDYDAYGRTLITTGDTAGGIDVLRKALLNDSDRAEAARINTRKTLSGMLRMQKRFEESAQVFSELVKQDPSLDNLNSLGFIYAQGGMEEKALEVYNQALAKSPEHLTILMSIGSLYTKDPTSVKMKEAYERAAVAAEKAGNKDVQGQAEGWVGYHFYSLKQYEEGIKHFTKSEPLLKADSPYLANFLLMTAVSYHQLKDLKNAEKYYKKVLERDPNHKTAKQYLETISKNGNGK